RYQPQFRLYEQNRTSVPPLDDPLRSAVTRLNMGSVAHIRRGADLERAGKIAEAIAEQQEALRVDPKAGQAHINLISLYADWLNTNQRPSTTGLGSISIEIRPIFITTT